MTTYRTLLEALRDGYQTFGYYDRGIYLRQRIDRGYTFAVVELVK